MKTQDCMIKSFNLKQIRCFLILVVFSLILFNCNRPAGNTIMDESNNGKVNNVNEKSSLTKTQVELDEIYSLLSYSIVLKYWQSDDRNGRGYNVGAVLVDPGGYIVDWDINSVNITENSTQHGEMRLISRYLDKDNLYSLKGYTIYPTLEPCAMCGGMMTMTSISRTVNGQKDYYFSKALERLSFDSRSIGGFGPYPRTVSSEETPSNISTLLDSAYLKYIDDGNKPIITKFLSTDIAKKIFELAKIKFESFQVEFPENKDKIEKAILFFNKLPKTI